MKPFALRTHSLRALPDPGRVERVLAAALAAVDPGQAVRRAVQRAGTRLAIGGRDYDLSRCRRVLVVGAGKAGDSMAAALHDLLGEWISDGLVVVKDGYRTAGRHGAIRIVEAGHPVPDERSVQAAQGIAALLAEAGPDDLALCLISGGGSALLVSPAPGVSLADLKQLTGLLLACGATIFEINSLRKHLDGIKGGGLARLAAPAALATLALSDVIGDPLDVIASGPTAPDPTRFADAWGVLERYDLLEQATPAVLAHLRRGLAGELAETPKPGDPAFARVNNLIIGSNLQAAQAALEQARREGFHPLLLTTYLQGEARQAGRSLAAIARQVQANGLPVPRPACILAGGETTVTIQGDGLGGRNQEMALGAAAELAGLPQTALVCLATDGSDGPTDAAGAVVSGETLARARGLGLDPAAFLRRNDSYHFFEALDDLLRPGPTLTNVNDLAFLFLL
jgi:hydroxypyruvate reductase